MSNVSTNSFVPVNTNYAPLNQSSVPADKPLEVSPSVDNLSKFLKDTSSAPKESNMPLNKESLEKLFTMFEFAIKAMRSMLAGMGVLPKPSGELDAQSQVKPGPDSKTVPNAKTEHKVVPGTDTKTTVLPGTDAKTVPNAKTEHKVAPGTDTKTTVLPGTDTKIVPDAKTEHKVAPEADTKAQVQPGPEVKVLPDGRAQVTITPDGKPGTLLAKTLPGSVDNKNKLSSDINVTVQVQNCHCPHTGEKVAPQPPVMPGLDKQPLPQPPVTPGLDKQPLPQPPVTPGLDTQPLPQPPVMPGLDTQPLPQPPVTPGLDTQPLPQPPVTPPTPDLTCPAPDDLVSHSQMRFDNHRANRPGLRSRF